jgi:hypothetical protein
LRRQGCSETHTVEARACFNLSCRNPARQVGETPGAQEAWQRGLQQFDRRDFQRIALHVAADVHAKVVFLVRGFESFNDLCVSLCIELQELLVLRYDPEATRCTL